MKIEISKMLIRQKILISTFSVLALLLSFVSHSHDISIEQITVEQLDCKLCQQKVDPSFKPLALSSTNIGQFTFYENSARLLVNYRPALDKPSQRAPPIS